MVFGLFQAGTFCQKGNGGISQWPKKLQVIRGQLQTYALMWLETLASNING